MEVALQAKNDDSLGWDRYSDLVADGIREVLLCGLYDV